MFGPAGAMAFLAVLTAVLVRRRSHTIVRTLNDTHAFLVAIIDDAGDRHAVSRGPALQRARRRLGAAVREHVVRSDGDKIVLSRPLPTLRREYAEDEVAQSFWFSVGGNLTGLALVATFVLIAIVMTTEVSGAIQHSQS